MKKIDVYAQSLPDAWFQCIWNVLDLGREYKVAKGGSFEGQERKEFDFVTVKIETPFIRPLAPDVPKHFAIPPPTNDEAIEKYFSDYLYNPTKQELEDYTYGERLIGNINQVEECIKKHKLAIEEGGGTNQATMEIGMPSDIKLESPPCLRLIDTKILDGQLHFIIYFRSWDLWSGFPVNLGGLQLLKEFMVSEIGVEDGGMIALSKGLHLYDHCWDIAKIRTNKMTTPSEEEL